jgi:dihydroxy-acid dehydratase
VPAAPIVDLCRRYYEQDDASVLPRSIASFKAFENAMAWTWPWAARPIPCCTSWPPRSEAGVDFTMKPTSTAFRARCPACARWRRTDRTYHIEDVHRAGGIMGILGELDRAGLLTAMCRRCT